MKAAEQVTAARFGSLRLHALIRRRGIRREPQTNRADPPSGRSHAEAGAKCVEIALDNGVEGGVENSRRCSGIVTGGAAGGEEPSVGIGAVPGDK